MNRRSFISLLAGAAGAPLVPWRGLVSPTIFLPGRHVCDSPWCNDPNHLRSLTAEEIVAGIKRTLDELLRNSGLLLNDDEGFRRAVANYYVPPKYTVTLNLPDHSPLVLDAWPADEVFEVNWS